jgi:hypothetical protein
MAMRCVPGSVLVAACLLAAAACSAAEPPAPMQPVVDPVPAASEATDAPAAAPAPVPVATHARRAISAVVAVDSPRRARWAPMKVEYLLANTHHPPLVFDSVQEKVKFDDARMSGLDGMAASVVYEWAQFSAHLALCPVYLATRPPWRRDRAEP